MIVWRRPPGGLERSYRCGTLPLEGLDLDALPQRWGGGEYRLAFRTPTGPGGRPVIRKWATVRFDPAIPAPRRAPDPDTFPLPPAGAEPVSAGLLAELRQLRAEVQQLRAGAPAPPAGPASPAFDTNVVLNLLVKMLESHQAAAAVPPANQLFEAMKMGLELARSIGRGEDEPERSRWMDVAAQIGARLVEAMGQGVPPGTAPAAGAVPVQVGTALPTAAPPTAPAPPAVRLPGFLGSLERRLPQLLGWAHGGLTPTDCAEDLADDLEREFEVNPTAATGIDRPAAQLYSELLLAHPEIRDYASWFRQLIDDTRSIFEEAPGGETGGPESVPGGSDPAPTVG